MATLFTDEQLRKNEKLFVDFCKAYGLGPGYPMFDLLRGLMLTSEPDRFIEDWLQRMVDMAPSTFPVDGMPR